MRIIYILLILPCFLALLSGAPTDNYLPQLSEEKDDKGAPIKTFVAVCYKLVNYFILFMYYQPLLNRIYSEFVKIFGNNETPYDYYDFVETTTRSHHHHHHHHHHQHPHRHHHHHHHGHHHERKKTSQSYEQNPPVNEDTVYLTPNPNSYQNQRQKVYSNR